jgi:fido (protein-threonine AMPylation protein)
MLYKSPVHPGYDLPHVCAIHRRIFGDIYDWAGADPDGRHSSTGQTKFAVILNPGKE